MINLNDYSSKGILTFAQNTNSCDYLKLAYLQALSAKHTQVHNQYAVAITPGMHVPNKYREVFDYVIDIPWKDDAANFSWKLQNEWKAIHISPFEQTLKVESDLLFTDDLSDWWKLYDYHDFVPTMQVHTYRNEVATSRFYRKTFDSNELPDLYSGLMYFRKSELAHEVYSTVHWLFSNYREKANVLLDQTRPKHICTDIAFALASKMLGLTYPQRFSSFVHMKKHIHNVNTEFLTEDWSLHLNHYFDENMNLYVEHFKQTLPFHYHSKSFCTDALIEKYERVLGI